MYILKFDGFSQEQPKWGETQSISTENQDHDRQSCPLSLYLFDIMLEALAIAIQQWKESKEMQIGRERIKISISVYIYKKQMN